MNMTEPASYVTQNDPPMFCAAFPCVDGWRARPIGGGLEQVRSEDVAYIQHSLHQELLSVVGSRQSAQVDDLQSKNLQLRRRVYQADRALKLVTLAFAALLITTAYLILKAL